MNNTIKNKISFLIKLFILGFIVNFLFDYLFRPSDIDVLRNLFVSFGVSIGITFGGRIFTRKSDK